MVKRSLAWCLVYASVGLGLLGLPGCLRSPLQRGSTATETANAVGWYSGGSNQLAQRQWLRVNRKTKTVDVTLIAELNHHPDLNGYQNGRMTVGIPIGWHVRLHFRNQSTTTSHRLTFVRYNSQHHWDAETPAHPGGNTEVPARLPVVRPGTTQTLAFVAKEKGHYVMTCTRKGHPNAPMWANLVITPGQTEPRIWVRVDG